MCVTVDEPWEVYSSWYGRAKCSDCGRMDRVLFEAIGPEVEYDDNTAAEKARLIAFNDGVPDWSEEGEDLAYELASDIIWLVIEPESTIRTCPQCLEALRWLNTWCRSWMFGDYRSDIYGHWEEDEVTHTIPMARLAIAAKNRWRTHQGRLMSVEEVAALVDASLDRLRADSGRQFAA